MGKFTGIAFDLLHIRANAFDGYGFSFFTITWLWAKKVTFSNSASLLHLTASQHFDYGGEEWQLNGSFLFIRKRLKTWVIKPRKTVCLNCGEYCEDTKHYSGNSPYCSEMCKMDGIL